MKALVQRVSRGRVVIGGEVAGEIGLGLVVLLGVARGDTGEQAEKLVRRLARARLFAGPGGHFDRDLEEVEGALLVVSQFTLCARTRKGRRPSFDDAAPPEEAESLYDHFVAAARARGLPVATGRFGAAMQVELANEGPVTFLYEA